MRTQIILQGDNDDIEILNESLSSIEWKIEEDSGEYLLYHKCFDELNDEKSILSLGNKFLIAASGALNIFHGNRNRISAIGIKREIDKKTYKVTKHYGINLKVKGKKDINNVEFSNLIDKSLKDENVRLALEFLSEISWWNLYKVNEVIEKDLNNQKKNVRHYTKKSMRSRFTQTAQSIDVLGDKARHANSDRYKAPTNPMSIEEAIEFIKNLFFEWIKKSK
jgi:hypothetical protein